MLNQADAVWAPSTDHSPEASNAAAALVVMAVSTPRARSKAMTEWASL